MLKHHMDRELVGGLEPWNFLTFNIIIGNVSSSQLTNSIILQRGGSTTNQITWTGKDLEVQTWGPWQKRSME